MTLKIHLSPFLFCKVCVLLKALYPEGSLHPSYFLCLMNYFRGSTTPLEGEFCLEQGYSMRWFLILAKTISSTNMRKNRLYKWKWQERPWEINPHQRESVKGEGKRIEEEREDNRAWSGQEPSVLTMKQKCPSVHNGTTQELGTKRMKTGVKQWISEFQ